MVSAPYIPETAPFSTEQRAWLNGFVAGLFSSEGGDAASTAVERKPVTILWGSQTGNSEGLARKVGKTLGGKGFEPTVFDMADYDTARLPEETLLLIVTSTYGDGEPPDNAAAFHQYLMGDAAPQLKSLRYSVLALGDKNYPDFCKCGIEIDGRLKALGASPLVERVDCDVDFDEAFAAWLGKVESAAGAALSADSEGESEAEDEEGPVYGKKNPYVATLRRSLNLNGQGSAKETRHVEIDLGDSGIRYEAGDALAVKPLNNSRLVDELIRAAGFEPHELAPLPHGEDGPLFDALREHYDITTLSPAFVQACARLTKAPELQKLVADETALSAYLEGRQMIDPVLEFGVVFPTTEYLVAPLRQLQSRLYSIASGPSAHPGQVHATVGVVRYDSHGREREGVCSNFLARLEEGGKAPVYIHANKNFRPPSDSETPMIMVGPGTGIAPFRAFLEERAATGATGRNWLFFGDQRESCDFLYREQLEGFLEDGTLARLDTAFSRDQEAKVYVQDRMREQGEELFQWLEGGACFYVCGDAARMAKDVDTALRQVVATRGGMSEEDADAYVDAMKQAKRYQRDVY